MINEKGLDPAAADRIGEFVQLSGGTELAEKLIAGKCSLNHIFVTWDFVQGDTSGCSPDFVDTNIKVALLYRLCLLNRNFCFDVNRT